MVKCLTCFKRGFANTTIHPTFCACKPMTYLKIWGIKHDILKFIRDFGIVKASQKNHDNILQMALELDTLVKTFKMIELYFHSLLITFLEHPKFNECAHGSYKFFAPNAQGMCFTYIKG
jgi:hypothetical protein